MELVFWIFVALNFAFGILWSIGIGTALSDSMADYPYHRDWWLVKMAVGFNKFWWDLFHKIKGLFD